MAAKAAGAASWNVDTDTGQDYTEKLERLKKLQVEAADKTLQQVQIIATNMVKMRMFVELGEFTKCVLEAFKQASDRAEGRKEGE